MYLVDEEDIVGFEGCENAGEVARFVEHRTACELESHAKFVGNDIAQRGLSESRRSVQECMVERFASVFCCFDEDLQIFHHLALAAEVRELERTQCLLELFFCA